MSGPQDSPGGALFLVGIGPGDPRQLTGRAEEVLGCVDVIVGYELYAELVRPLFPDRTYIVSPITQERERAHTAVERALDGQRVALIGSGDSGVYGLASLALERLEELDEHTLPLEVVPGVTAALSAAALLGAPLGHDFCTISLSDLLTPWEIIMRRIEAAAGGDFVTVLYNPASRRRTSQLLAAVSIFLQHRDAETPVGLVTNGYRTGQAVRVTRLAALPREPVGMLTTVIIGNSATRRWRDRLITPRGYTERDSTSAVPGGKAGS